MSQSGNSLEQEFEERLIAEFALLRGYYSDKWPGQLLVIERLDEKGAPRTCSRS